MPGQRPLRRARAWSSVTPGSGLIMMAPVSVCHQVSTTGVRSPPMTWRYQIHASGLIGSPTDAEHAAATTGRTPAGISSPHFMNVRIAVGRGVEDRDPYFSMISHQRPRCGVSGVPSYITCVAPLASGP